MTLTENELEQLRDKSLDRSMEILEVCYRENVSILTLADAAYPQRLKNIHDPPVVLYVLGRLPMVDELPVIGVVGTRNSTPYGIKMGRIIGSQLAAGGGVVATGLAAGVDSAAAVGALRAGGRCIGVLGCPINEVYPRNNRELYKDVAAEGALVSEYPPGAPLRGSNFPERNRIISGLSVGVTVIEAPRGSGALITAGLALEQGREIFAVPGNADAVSCEGSNDLIREGAVLVTSGWDVLESFRERFPHRLKGPDQLVSVADSEVFAPPVDISQKPTDTDREPVETGENFARVRVQRKRKNVDNEKKREYIDLKEQLKNLTEDQLKIISVIERPGIHVDDIIDASGLSSSVVLAELTLLQIKGLVLQENGKRFTLNIAAGNK